MSIAARLRRQGRGTKLLVVHGGPGFSADYLVTSLSFLAEEHELIFYDQMRTHEAPTRPLTVEILAEQLLTVLDCLEANREPLQVVVHSWGALVMAAAAARDPQLVSRATSGGLFINPVPLDRAAYDQSVRNFVNGVPYYIRLIVPIIALCGVDGAYVIRLLWPSYGSKRRQNAPPPDNFSFDFQTYKVLTRTLGHFDYSGAIPTLKHLSLVLSSTDPTTPLLIQNWINQAKSVEVIEEGGHFPLQANPSAWKQQVLHLLRSQPD